MALLDKILKFSVIAFFLILPWQVRYFLLFGTTEYSTIALYGSDLIALVLLLLSFFYFRKNRTFTFSRNNLVAGIFALIYSVVTIFFATNKIITAYFILKIIISLLIFWAISKSAFSREKLLGYFFIGLVPPALLAIYQFVTQTTFVNKWLGLAGHQASGLGQIVIETANGERWLRAYGSFDHPNILGGVMAVALLLLLFKNARQWQITDSFYAIIFSSALFFSFSRTAWLGLAVGLGVYVMIILVKKIGDVENRIRFFKVTTLVVMVFVSLSSIYPSLVFARASVAGRLEEKSISERLSGYQEAKIMFLRHPFLGYGFGNYVQATMNKLPGQPSWRYQPVHNVFLLVLVESGLFGVLGFVIILKMLIINNQFSIIKKGAFKNCKLKIVNLTPQSLALLAAVLIMMLFDHWWWSLHFGLFFLGAIIALASKDKMIAD